MSTKQSFSILVWQVKYRAKNGKAPLSIRISVNGERAEIRTNREVAPTLWDSKAQRMKGNSEEAKSVNAHLETIKGSLKMHESRLIALEKTVTAEILKNEYLGIRPDKHTLCTAFEVYSKRLGEKVKVGNKATATLDKYMCYIGYVYEDAFSLGPENVFIGIDARNGSPRTGKKPSRQNAFLCCR